MSQRAENAVAPKTTRKAEILRIAAKVFAEKGITAASVRDISDAAGILSGSLYSHFRSKDEIVERLLRPYVEESYAQYQRIEESDNEALVVLRRLIKAGVDESARYPLEAQIIRHDAHRMRKIPSLVDVDETRRLGFERWVRVVELGVEQGTIRPEIDVRVVVAAMFDALYGTIIWFPPIGNSDPDVVGNQLADVLIRGISL